MLRLKLEHICKTISHELLELINKLLIFVKQLQISMLRVNFRIFSCHFFIRDLVLADHRVTQWTIKPRAAFLIILFSPTNMKLLPLFQVVLLCGQQCILIPTLLVWLLMNAMLHVIRTCY